MALILCHHCFSWVEPLGEQCPQCDFPLDARNPDPPFDELSAVIGRLVGRIGEVRIVGTTLPDRGSLYETTHGLFFVPLRREHIRMVHGIVHRNGAGRRLQTLFGASLRAPLALLGMPSGHSGPRIEVAVEKHRPLEPADSDELPTLLMQNPGVFFVSRRWIREVRHTLWGWTIVRSNSLVLRFKPIGDRTGFQERMSTVALDLPEAACR